MMVLPNTAGIFNQYRTEQMMQEAEFERLVLQAREGEREHAEPKKPAYCCIKGDGKGNFVLEMEAA